MRNCFSVLLASALCLLYPKLVSADGLLGIYQETVESDPRIAIAEGKKLVGEFQEEQAFSRLLPQVSIQNSWTENKRIDLVGPGDDSYKGEKYALVVQQQLFNRSLWKNHERYEYLKSQSQNEAEEVASSVALDVIERYLAVLSAEDDLELILAEKDAVSAQLRLVKSRHARQLALITDVLEVESRLSGIYADEIDANNKVSIAREALTELVNRPVTQKLDRVIRVIPYIQDGLGLEHWIQYGVSRNRRLLALIDEVNATEAQVGEARSAHLPTLSLQLSAQRSNIGFENSQAGDSETYVAALNLSMPLYSGGGDSAKVYEAIAQVDIAKQQLEEEKRRLIKDIREAYLNAEANWMRTEAAHKAVVAAKKSYEAQKKGFKFGTVTVVDVLDALREQHRFERDFRQSQYEFIRNYSLLLKLVGSLDLKNVERIDGWLKANQ